MGQVKLICLSLQISSSLLDVVAGFVGGFNPAVGGRGRSLKYEKWGAHRISIL